jgi:hypothetical protein
MALEPTNKRPPADPLAKLVLKMRDAGSRHKERHSPTGFGFAFADRIDYLDGGRWDEAVTGQSVFMRRDVLRHIETHGPENVQPRYVLIFRGNKPVAALAAQIVSVAGDRLQPQSENGNGTQRTGRLRLVKKVLRPARQRAVGRLQENILVAGNLLAWGFHGVAFAPDEDPAALWPAVAEALYRLRRAHRLSGEMDFVIVKDITTGQSGLKSLERWSYRPLETEPNMVLKIDPSWKSYDDYLAALDSKYRKNCRDQAKKLAAAGVIIEPLADVPSHSSHLHKLYLQVHGNAAVRLMTLPESYLPGLADVLGSDFACHVARRGDETLGFVTVVRDRDTAIGYLIGFDREATAGLPIYLRLLHSTIGDALRWGCVRLSLGRTALEPKAALGAKPEPMRVYVRHRLPMMNWLVRGILGLIPHAEAPERSPFKAVKVEV